MRRFIFGLLFGLIAGTVVGVWWLRRIGAFDDPNSLVGSLVVAAREAAAAHEAELTARFQQQVNHSHAIQPLNLIPAQQNRRYSAREGFLILDLRLYS